MNGRLSAALVVAVTGLLTACTSSGPTSTPPAPTSSSAAARTWSVVALGDSVPQGTNCDCTPYPPLSATTLTRPGHEVTATNDAVAGYTTTAVLQQLDSDPDVIAHVTAADAVEIEVGANDVARSPTCGTSLGCYTAELPAVETNLAAIVRRVHELNAGRHPVLVVLLDYWSVWLGGTYAAAEGDAYVATAGALTADVNRVIKTVASSSGSAYVDLRTAFKGPDHAYDETHYLADDGEHPNAAGHQKIAAAVVDVIQATLHV